MLSSARVRRAVGRSLVVLVVGACGLVAARIVVPFGGTVVAGIISNDVYDAAIFASAFLCLLRGVWERRDRAVWLLFGLAFALWGAGDLYWTLAVGTLPAAEQPYPSLADAGYLLFYPPAYIAILLLVRSRVTRFARSFFLDGAIVTLMVAALTEAVVLPVVLRATGGNSAAVATTLAYPVADSLLLALALAVVVFGGYRLSRDVILISAALLLFAIADSIYAYQVAAGSYVTNTLLDLGWLVPPVLVGVAAWMPHKEAAARGPLEGWVTIIVPAGLAFAALGVELYDHFWRVRLLPLALATGAIALSLIRLVLSFAENQRLLRKSRRDADSDPLTGLANRRALLVDAEELFRSQPLKPHVLAIYDLDGFKNYNDTFGHLAGDALLIRLAVRLRAVVDGRGRVYRLGGDEFCLLAHAATDAETFELVAEAGESLAEQSMRFVVRSSFGAAFIPEEAADVTEAMRLADRRMYRQKATRPARLAGTRDALLVALHERDGSLGEHVDDVGRLAVAVANELELEPNEVENIRTTAVLHDVGKLGIPDGILFESTPLTADERKYVETHTLVGERILAAAPATADIARYVRATHERWDGTGYPDGLRGNEIPLPARIVFVCDAFDAMTSDRPYQASRTPGEALAELVSNAGTQFDPEIVSVFSRILTGFAARTEAAA